MSTKVYYRLRIRNAADDDDELVISSFPSDDNPYILDVPNGDGQSFDPLKGEIFTGSYSVRVIDAETDTDTRVLTAVLADTDARMQLLSRIAIIETSDDGSTWGDLCNGYVNGIRLNGALAYEVAVGETQRKEVTHTIFKEATPLFGRTTAIIGGPIIGDDTTDFVGIRDYGGWRFKVNQVNTTYDYVQLKIVTAFDPRKPLKNGTLKTFSTISAALADATNELARPYFEASTKWVGTGFGGTPNIKGNFPGLTLRVQETDGTIVGFFTPIAEPQDGYWQKEKEDRITQKGQSSLWVDRLSGVDDTGAPIGTWNPSVGHKYDVYVYIQEIGEKNPLHVYGHPVDIWENLRIQEGIPYDASVLPAVRSIIGDDVRLNLRIKESQNLGDFDEQVIYGPLGLATRMENGERVLFSSRIKTATVPTDSITINDLRDPGKPFSLEESTAIKTVRVKQVRLTPWVESEDENGNQTQPDVDALIETPVTFEVENSDTDATVEGSGEVTYEIPGFISTEDGHKYFSTERFIIGLAQEIFDRWGRGIPTAELNCLPSITAKLGEEIILDLTHLPVSVVGQTPVTQRGGERIYQIVQRTETPSGPNLKLLDAGSTTAASVVPTFSISANATEPRKYVDLSITNGPALVAIGAKVKVFVATGTGTPASGSGVLITTIDPSVETDLTLPPFNAGTKVWVQLQSVLNDSRPSALTSWASVTLTGLTAPSGLAVSAEDTGDVSRRMLTWTNGETDIPVEVSTYITSEGTGARRVVAVLPPGSTQYELTGLTNATYTASVRHIESPPFSGASSYATVSVVVGSSTPRTLNPPINPRVFSTSSGLYGMDVDATEFPSSVEFQVKVGAGSFATVGVVDSELVGKTSFQDVAPNDGETRYMRARHIADGLTESAWTATLTVNSWSDQTITVITTDTSGYARTFLLMGA